MLVRFETYDEGRIPHCLLIAHGRRYDTYLVFDAVGLDWGERAETMRRALRPGAKRFEVKLPDGERRRYTTLDGAKRAIVRHAN